MYAEVRKDKAMRVMIALVLLFTMSLVGPQTVAAQDSAQGGAFDPTIGQDGAVIVPPQPGVVRHEPGHLARVSDLDVRVATGQASDPLAGNTTLIAWDKIAMVMHGTDDGFTRKTYDVDANLNAPVVKQKLGSARVNGAGNMDIAAGYLGGTAGWMDTAAAWEYPAGIISVYVASYNSSLGVYVDRLLTTTDPVQGGVIAGYPPYGGLIRLDTGDFELDGYDEFVVAWEGAGKSLNLRTYDTNGGFTAITPKGKITDEMLGDYKFLDVATGDFNGDGRAEIVVAWEDADSKLAVKVYSVTSDGNLVAEVKVVEASRPGRVSVTTGDFNGDAIDEIAVAFNTQAANNLYLYQVTDNLHALTRKAGMAFPAGAGNGTIVELVGRVLGLRAADFNADGIDELVLAGGASTKWYCDLTVYAVDPAFTLTQRATLLSSWLTAYGDLSLAVGDLNRDSIAEIVAGSVYGSQLGSNDVDVGMFQVTPDLGTIVQKGYRTSDDYVGYTGYNAGHVAVAAGAFDGKSVRLGPPVYKHLAQTKQIVAVINAPPKHGDELNGQVIDVNITDRCTIPPCTYAKYETETKTTTTMQLSSNRDWSVSAEADLHFPHVKASMKASYGESFEKTTTSFQSTEFGQDVEADADDVVVRLEQDLDMWEYPMYADGSDQIQGYILVTWPVKADPACSGNCPAAITARVDGMNPTSYYRPNHEFGNVLSYSPQPPTDISTTVKSDVMTYMGSNAYQMWVKWSDVQDSETKSSSKLDLEASLTISGWGQSLTTSGTYAQGETTVNKVSFEQSTQIHLYFFGIEQKYSYGVRPIMYWAKPDGHLVLDYAVQPLTSTPPTWWQTTYNKADPAFNLPWKNGSLGDAYKHLSKEITFSPEAAPAGSTVAVTARVRNYSLIGALNVPVRFYVGDPDQGGAPIPGSDTVIANLPPLSSVPTTIQFNTAGHASGETLDIYAVIDPSNVSAEMHDENNKAYAQLPIVPVGVSEPPGPKSLFLAAEDIVFDPSDPMAGQTVHVSATIHAMNKTYNWVGVEFWDGRPAAGGQQIGGQLIPMVLAGESAIAAIDWPALDAFGQHEIWVTLIRHPDDQITTDNWAYQTVQLAPYPYKLHFPLISN